MEAQILDLLRSIEDRISRIEKRLYDPMGEIEPMTNTLSVVEEASYPDDRELEKRMRAAAENKRVVNGVLVTPGAPRSA